MEKSEKIIKESYMHYFYCDNCNQYLGTSEEHDDGWYEKFGEFTLSFYVKDEWYCIDKCLCDCCRDEFVDNLKSTLKNMGFNKD